MSLYDETTTFHGSGRREDLNRPHSCCWNNGSLFVTDTLNNRIVQIWDIPRLANADTGRHDPRAGQTPKDVPETNGRLYRTIGTSTTWMFPLGMISIPCYFKPEKSWRSAETRVATGSMRFGAQQNQTGLCPKPLGVQRFEALIR